MTYSAEVTQITEHKSNQLITSELENNYMKTLYQNLHNKNGIVTEVCRSDSDILKQILLVE